MVLTHDNIHYWELNWLFSPDVGHIALNEICKKKNTKTTDSLSFMSTPLPGSYSDDFEQSKNTIFIKHPPDCQLSSAWLHRKTE